MSQSSLKKNIIANYASQLFVIAISVLMLPKLIAVIGAEAYGLIGFFTLMQSWLMLLDVGMSPTLTREIARFKGGALDANNLLHFFKSIKKIFIGVAICVLIIIISSSPFIVTSWLKSELPYSILLKSIILMALVLSIRWVSTIYRATVTGYEKLVWLGLFNSCISTLRFVIVFPVLMYFNNSAVTFFVFQIIVAIIELIVLVFYARTLLPKPDLSKEYSIRPFKEVIGFSLMIAVTSSIWVVVTQTDKLILSKILALSEYGYYSLAIQVAGAITLISGPISSAILPRLTRLEAEKNEEELINLYRRSTRLIVVIVGAVALVLIFFTDKVVYLWTGDLTMIPKLSKYIMLYAIGNLLLAISAFPYYLQYAKGNLKLHLYGNLLFLLILIPVLYYVVNKYGGIGAGYVWIGLNTICLFMWVPFVNNYFVKGLNSKWYFNDIFKIILPTIFVGFLLKYLMPSSENRILIFLQLALCGSILLATSIIFAGLLKNIFIKGKND